MKPNVDSLKKILKNRQMYTVIDSRKKVTAVYSESTRIIKNNKNKLM